MMRSILLVAAAAVIPSIVLASPLHSLSTDGWDVMPVDANPNRPHAFRLALFQRNLDVLEARLEAVSNPDSPAYTSFMTIDEMTALVRPTQSHIDATLSWLKAAGATDISLSATGADYVTATLPHRRVETEFGVSLSFLSHSETKRMVVRALSPYSIPSGLEGVVRAVDGVTFERGVLNARRMESRVGSDPGENITPPVIHKQYQVPDSPSCAAKGGIAVAEFEQAYFYPADLASFEALYNLPNQPIAKIVGKNKPNSGYLGECSLDVEYAVGTVSGAPLWMFSLDQFDLVAWGQEVLSTAGAPLVQSVSWGSEENTYASNTLQSVNAEFMKLGVTGFTVLVASGDEGTGHTGLFRCGEFAPAFPATSPYVTAVGGTSLTSGTESGWSDSGGGFSAVFGRPAFQDEAVKAYLSSASGLPDSSFYNSSNRAIPDVSALATNFQVLITNSTGPLSGTSAATPTFAAILSAINGARAAAGKPGLGFVSPVLYKNADALTDILAGNNRSPPCSTGFPAEKGWDPITGSGTPVYPKLMAALS